MSDSIQRRLANCQRQTGIMPLPYRHIRDAYLQVGKSYYGEDPLITADLS